MISGVLSRSVNFKIPHRFLCRRRPVFPDFLSVSYDYGESNQKFGRVTKDLEIMQSVYKPNMTIDVTSASNLCRCLIPTSIQRWNYIKWALSHRRCSVRKGIFTNFAKFTRKHLCQSVFFNKVEGLRPATLLKRDSDTGVFLCISRNF